MVKDKQLNAGFISPFEYTEEETIKKRFRKMAQLAVQEYLREARSVPRVGEATELAIWPEILPPKGIIQPLDAFEIND